MLRYTSAGLSYATAPTLNLNIVRNGADKAVILNIVHSELYRIILPINTITIRRYHCFRTYDPDKYIT
jgi:hypothetical protein